MEQQPVQQLDVCDSTLYYERDIGRPGMPVLVFLHGTGCNHTMWKRPREHFAAQGYGVIAVDIRGEGKSRCSHEHFDLPSMVSDMERVLDKECIERAVFIGYSMGASISMAFAAAHPGRVQGLVLISSSYDFTKTFSRTPARRQFVQRAATWCDLSILINKSLRPWRKVDNFYPDLSHDRYASFGAFLADCFLDPSRDDYELLQKRRFKILEWNLEPLLPHIIAPVCIIHGAEDGFVPVETAFELSQMMPGARIPIIIPEAGHNVMSPAGDRIIRVIERFVENTT